MPYKPYKNEETRTSILNGVRTGAEEAWGRFFDTYAGYVFAIATHAGLVGSDADEIVQTVFTELSRPGGFDGYERGKGSFRGRQNAFSSSCLLLCSERYCAKLPSKIVVFARMGGSSSC